ncbi:MAG: DUF2490 domain-containing protein [Chitinophagaceae bacterium]|nr:DUF2490 domain-containing protein [Chitinophagaceae bacterium]
MKLFIFSLLLMIPALQSFSQAQFNGWLASFYTVRLKNNFSIQSDVQLRSSDQVEHVQTLLLRAGINYNTSKNLMLTTGYAYIDNLRTLSDQKGYVSEHRVWQQLLISQKVAGFIPVSHRFRLEQRFIGKPVLADDNVKKDGHAYANRTRYFLRGIIPFNGQKKFSKGMFGAAQNEIFVQFGNTRNVNGKTFDQNRAYLALGYRFSPRLDTEAGYMNQYISGRNEAFTNNHILQVVGYLKL